MDPVRVLLVDDQELFADGLRAILESHPRLRVVGYARDGRDAVERALALKPDVILMDIKMPHMDGVQATAEIKRLRPEFRIVFLTTFDEDEYVFAGMKAGASGYVLKDSPAADMLRAVEVAARGGVYLSPLVAARVVAEFVRVSGHDVAAATQEPAEEVPAEGHLTDREIEVLRLLAGGKSNREIAHALYIAEGTVKNHVSNIYRKLDARDRTQALLLAQQHRLV